MTLFIQGLAIPLDTKNVNGWGIPAAETTNVINSLKNSTLRICPGEAHACDFTGDPNGRIGRSVDAWLEKDGIHAKYEVTDSVAARKLKENTWDDLKWSAFADSKINPLSNDGWAGGVTVKSMTLVKNPAWSQAHYQVAASTEETTTLRLFSDFQLIASQTEGETITIEDDLKAANLKIIELQKEIDSFKKSTSVSASTIEELNAQVTTLTASVSEKETGITEAKTQITEITASKETLEKDLETKTALIASLEKEKAGSVPMTELKTIIAAAIEEHDQQLKTVNARDEAFKMFASAREALGLETKQEEFTTLSAADLSKLASDLGTVKLSAGTQIKYPIAPNAGNSDLAIGAYNDKTGKWEK